MRVAWVLYGDLSQRTGGTIYDAMVVGGLRAAGDDVVVVSLPRPRLLRTLRAMAPDVVVGDELCFRELGPTFTLLRGTPTKRVLLVHHLTAWETELAPWLRRITRVREAFAMRAADQIVTTSESTRRRLLAEAVTPPIAVALPGADRLKRTGRGDAPAGALRFVFLGSIVPRKRVLELVGAFASTSGRLVLVGSITRDEPYVRAVRALAQGLGVADRVEMTGEIDESRVASVLGGADALVMPSSLEGYGIAATEAIHAGVPVIAARAQGLEEALAPCRGAYLFADDQPSLATALRQFASDPALRASMTAAAGAARMPTWSACAKAFRAALHCAR